MLGDGPSPARGFRPLRKPLDGATGLRSRFSGASNLALISIKGVVALFVTNGEGRARIFKKEEMSRSARVTLLMKEGSALR